MTRRWWPLACATATYLPCTAQVTTRDSVSTSQTEGNDVSRNASVSSDGRFVAFESGATNLVDGDTNNRLDIFVRDRLSGETVRVSVSSSGAQGNHDSSLPSISGDGRYIAFLSRASNLVPSDTNSEADVFVHDRQSNTTSRVSVSEEGGQANGRSERLAISQDGEHVAFESLATNLVPGDTNGFRDIFVRQIAKEQTLRVSVSGVTGMPPQANNNSFDPSISANGEAIAFTSHATNLVSNDTNGARDVFVRDLRAEQTRRVSVRSGGFQVSSGSFDPSISGDGRFVAFWSGASTFVPEDDNGAADVFVHERASFQTTRVSLNSEGAEGNSTSQLPSISTDGRFVAFESESTNLVASDLNGVVDVFVRDREAGRTARASVSSSGAEADAASVNASIAGAGEFVSFESGSSQLVAPDTNGMTDVFTRDRIPVGDANGDGVVDFVDLNIVLSDFGQLGQNLAGDLDDDGDVDFVDLNLVLSYLGTAV